MFIKASAILASTFVLCALSAPLPQPQAPAAPSGKQAVTAQNLIAIAPATASCSGAPFPNECADATHAAAALNSAFAKYDITAAGEQAAIVAYTLFESTNYKYSQNHFPAPGRPGQGTRMMAMPAFVKQYASSIAAGQVAAAAAAGDAAVLALANSNDEKSFGMAPWFLTTKCSPQVRAGLVAGTTEGWHAFLTQCIATSVSPDRDTPWIAAKKVINGGA